MEGMEGNERGSDDRWGFFLMAAFYYYFIIRYFVFGRFPFYSGDLFTWDRKVKGGTKRKGDDEKRNSPLEEEKRKHGG